MADPNANKSVLEDEALVTDLRKRRGGIRAFLKSISTVVIFAFFVATFTLLVCQEPYVKYRTFQKHIRDKFSGESSPYLQDLDEVDSIETFWNYIDTTVLISIYGNESEYVYANRVQPKLIELDDYNRVLGAMRLRTVKVKPNIGCEIPESFRAAYDSCYGPYSSEATMTAAFGPPSAPFEFQSPAPTEMAHPGVLTSYAPGGYTEVLTTNRTATLELVRVLKDENWLDQASRAIFLDFTVWNGNNGFYGVSRIAFEIAPSGNWITTHDVNVLTQRYIQAFGYGTIEEWMMMIGEMLLCLFVLYYIAEELSECTILKWNYAKDGWNVLDWCNLILLIWVVGMRLTTYLDASSLQIGQNELDNPSYFTDMDAFARNIRFVREINAVNAVLIWVKAVKYVNFIPYVSTMIWTIRLSWQLFVSFAVVFLSAFIGFVIAYNVGFGDKFADMNTFPKAALFLARSFLGDADLTRVYYSAPLLGSLLIVLFVLGMYFIIMNIFYGIMVNALEEAKAKQEETANEKWQKFLQKVDTVRKLLWKGLDLDQRIKRHLPGLYARMHRRRRDRLEREKARKERLDRKEKARLAGNLMDVTGPHNPNAGRKRKRKTKANEAAAALGEDSSDSEVDLGPKLSESHCRHLRGKRGSTITATGNYQAPGKRGGVMSIDSEELMEAVEHMASGLMERTNSMRSVVLGEMKESKLLLYGISDVLEVLNRRVHDLEQQQNQFLESS